MVSLELHYLAIENNLTNLQKRVKQKKRFVIEVFVLRWTGKVVYFNLHKIWLFLFLFLLLINTFRFNNVQVWYLILIGHPGSLSAQFSCRDHCWRAIRRSDSGTPDKSTERIPWVIIIRLIKTGTERCKYKRKSRYVSELDFTMNFWLGENIISVLGVFFISVDGRDAFKLILDGLSWK